MNILRNSYVQRLKHCVYIVYIINNLKMLKVTKSQTYKQKKEAIYKYRETHYEKFQHYNTLSKRRTRAYQAEVKRLCMMLID